MLQNIFQFLTPGIPTPKATPATCLLTLIPWLETLGCRISKQLEKKGNKLNVKNQKPTKQEDKQHFRELHQAIFAPEKEKTKEMEVKLRTWDLFPRTSPWRCKFIQPTDWRKGFAVVPDMTGALASRRNDYHKAKRKGKPGEAWVGGEIFKGKYDTSINIVSWGDLLLIVWQRGFLAFYDQSNSSYFWLRLSVPLVDLRLASSKKPFI